MKLSASISPIWRRYGLNETEIYAAIQKCGFNYAGYDFCADNAAAWMNKDAKAWGREMKAQMTDVGAAPVIAHVCGVNPFDGIQSIEYVKQAVLCAGALGTANVVIPLGWRANNQRREYEEGNQQYIRQMLRAAEEADVTLLIEHCGPWHNAHYMHYSIEINRMMDKLGMPERLKANVNVANMGVAEVPPMEDIVLLGSAIRNVDAADNFGCMPLGVNPERENLGLAPMMGYIHYDEVMQGLCDVKYDGFINLRMDMPRVFEKNSPYYEKARVAIMPQELTARLLVWSRHIMEHMLRIYGCLDA